MGSFAILFSRHVPPSPEVAERMLAAAPQRGTVAGTLVCGSAVFAIAHRPDSVDAWLARSDDSAAVFGGSLDNAEELVTALADAGIAAEPGNPASLVLGASKLWGNAAPERLRGVFAACVTDGISLTCFRDQFGFATFFYRDDGSCFVAADEAKQVAAGAGIARTPDLEAAEAILFERLDERRTAFIGIERLPRASVCRITANHTPTFARYWDPTSLLESARLSVEQACEGLAATLESVIGRAITGADSIALSGGLDSPTVAAFAAQPHVERSGRPLLALTSVYPDHPSVDERPYVELVTHRLGLNLHTYVQEARTLDDLERWVDALDGPWSALPIPYAVEHYKLAQSHGARRIFLGDFAEYLFDLPNHLIGHLLLHGRFRAAARWTARRRSQGRTWPQIARSVAPSIVPVPAVRLWLALKRHSVRERQLAGIPRWISADQFETLGTRPDLERPARRRWLDRQVEPVGPYVVTGYEAATIAASHIGVDVRRPFADVDLWEFVLSLPAEVKYPDAVPKALLRRTMRGRLPDALLDRKQNTQFTEHMVATADYERLNTYLVDDAYRVPGIDYALLRERLERRELGPTELAWAYNLARVHAFARLWS